MARPAAVKHKARGDFIRELRDTKRYTEDTLAKAIQKAGNECRAKQAQDDGKEAREFTCSISTLRNLQRSEEMPEVYFNVLAVVFGMDAKKFYDDADDQQPADVPWKMDTHGRRRIRDACEGLLQGSEATRRFLMDVNGLDDTLTASELAMQILSHLPGSNNPLTYVSKCARYKIPADANDSVSDIGRNLFRLAEILVPVSVSPSEAARIQEYLSAHAIGTGRAGKSSAAGRGVFSGSIQTRYSLIAAAAIAATKGYSVDAREERTFEGLSESDNPAGVRRLGMLPPEGSRSRSIVSSFADGLARVLDPYDRSSDDANALAFVQDALRLQADEADVYFCVLFPPELRPSDDDLVELAQAFPELILLVSAEGTEARENISVLNQIKNIRTAYGQYAQGENL